MLSLTPQSQTCSKMSVFRAFVFVTSFNSIFWKTSEIKKIPWTICDLRYYFHFNIFRHHREKKCVKLRIKTDTGVWCTPRSQTPQYDVHCKAWLRGGMHSAEFLRHFVFLTLRCDSHRGVGVWLHFMMHTAESFSVVWWKCGGEYFWECRMGRIDILC